MQRRPYYKGALRWVSDPDPVFLPGSGSGFQISLDPDPFLKISQPPDPRPKKEY